MLLRPKLPGPLKRSLVGVLLATWPVIFPMSVFAAVSPAAPRHPRTIPGSFLVDLQPGADLASLRGLLRTQGGRIHHAYSLIPGRYNVRGLPAGAATALSRLPGVLRVRPDFEVRAMLIESVPLIGGLFDDPDLWEAFGGAGIGVCVLDSGINRFHIMFDDDNNPETPTGRVSAWRDFIHDEVTPHDDFGHGSHVAGIIFGRLGLILEGLPFQGVAPKARIIAGKVLNSGGFGTSSDVQAGIEWCAGFAPDSPFPPARIINLSLGFGAFTEICDTTDLSGIADTVNAAAAAGVLVVAAAGNEANENAVITPACASGAMAVGATHDGDFGSLSFSTCDDRRTAADQAACFTNGWDNLDVVAPGCLINSAGAGGFSNTTILQTRCGTSMSAAHVSGLAALIMAASSSITADAVRTRLQSTALDLGPAGHDRIFGHGRVQAGPAVGGCFGLGPTELFCGDGLDGDCDGLVDCGDPDCCGGAVCAATDQDGDGFGGCDCDDGNGNVWSPPGAAGGLEVEPLESNTLLRWQAPAASGGLGVAYDLLKSTVAADFDAAASCLETNDSTDTEALERKSPAIGKAFFYLVRSRNDCPGGDGGIGFTSSGVPRFGRTCP